MESGPCLFTTEGEQSWHSVQDVMESLGSMTLFPEGCLNLEGENTKSSSPFSISSITPTDGNLIFEQRPISKGRGGIISSMAASSVMCRDAVLQRDLRYVCGQGFSNELIEHYWGHNSESTSEHESSDCVDGQFDLNSRTSSDSDTNRNESKFSPSSHDNRSLRAVDSDIAALDLNIRFQYNKGKSSDMSTKCPTSETDSLSPNGHCDLLSDTLFLSDLLKPVKYQNSNASKMKCDGNKTMKKHPPKCRNALILGLQKNRKKQKNLQLLDSPVEEFPLLLKSSDDLFGFPNLQLEKYSSASASPTWEPSNYRNSLSHNGTDFNLQATDFPPL